MLSCLQQDVPKRVQVVYRTQGLAFRQLAARPVQNLQLAAARIAVRPCIRQVPKWPLRKRLKHADEFLRPSGPRKIIFRAPRRSQWRELFQGIGINRRLTEESGPFSSVCRGEGWDEESARNGPHPPRYARRPLSLMALRVPPALPLPPRLRRALASRWARWQSARSFDPYPLNAYDPSRVPITIGPASRPQRPGRCGQALFGEVEQARAHD
jgi:hypothetical protein